MIINKNTIVLIPCAGHGKRSKLHFPKSLYKIQNKSILSKIIDDFKRYKFKYKIVINKKNLNFFKIETKKNKLIEFIYQNQALGMGDAVLKLRNSKDYKKILDVILIWGDIPFIKPKTIDILIKKHFKNKNDFTFITGMAQKPYTLVKRDKYNKVKSVSELKNSKKITKYGERDIGIFIFKKKYIIKYLLEIKKKHKSKNEISFLKVIALLNKNKFKIEAINIADQKEMKSLNYISDLK